MTLQQTLGESLECCCWLWWSQSTPHPPYLVDLSAQNLLSSKLSVKEGRGRGRERSWSAPHQTPVVGFYLGKGLGKGGWVSGDRHTGT